MSKRLTKSSRNKMVCGVCGGLAEYFDLDPTIVRLAFALFTIVGGGGVLGYIVAALIMPEDTDVDYE